MCPSPSQSFNPNSTLEANGVQVTTIELSISYSVKMWQSAQIPQRVLYLSEGWMLLFWWVKSQWHELWVIESANTENFVGWPSRHHIGSPTYWVLISRSAKSRVSYRSSCVKQIGIIAYYSRYLRCLECWLSFRDCTLRRRIQERIMTRWLSYSAYV